MDLLNGKYAYYNVLGISIAALLFPLLIMVTKVLEHTQGVFAYPLDDSYIHLAVAKNLTLHNIWGVTPYEFSSADSSILYPFLLSAIFKIIGIHTIVPFIINLITAIAFIVVLQRWLSLQKVSPTGQLITLLLIIFFIPLPAIVMVGMEHTLHLLFFFLFITSFSEAMENMISSADKKMALPVTVLIYGTLMMAIRFESIFLLAIACSILLFHKRWLTSLRLGFICFLPVLIFGCYSLAKGSYFLPNSVMIKPAIPHLELAEIIDYIKDVLYIKFISADESYNTLGAQRLLLLVPVTYLLFRRSTRDRISYRYILLMLIPCTFFHIAFMTGSFFARYEAYLVGTFVIIGSLLIIKYQRGMLQEKENTPKWIIRLLGVLLLIPLVTRSLTIFEELPLGAICTYDQQFQMGRFVHKYYDRQPIAFNDIGAVSYQAEGKNLDLWGLGNIEVTRRRRNYTDSAGFQDSISQSKGVQIAVIYEARFKPLAALWKKVASWHIPYKKKSIYDSVSFFAIKPSEAPLLMENLKKFQPSLPRGVIVKYF